MFRTDSKKFIFIALIAAVALIVLLGIIKIVDTISFACPANTVIGQKDNYPNASALALTYPTVPRPKPQTIFFLHQSKSGGTSVCKIISQYSDVPMTDVDGKATGPFGQYRESCNVLFKSKEPGSWQIPRYCADLIPYTMDDQMRAYQRKNWIVVESTWYDEMPCPGYRSFTIMRHPVKRYFSFINYIGMNKTAVLDILRGEEIPEGEVTEMVESSTPTEPLAPVLFRCTTDRLSSSCARARMMFEFPVNSPAIRQLLGYSRKMDQRPIDEKDFEQAKVLVDRFDAFVPLEYLQHPNVQRRLNETVPEYYQAWVKSGGNMKANKSTKQENIDEEEELKALLFEQNKYDLLLYEYVLEKNGI